MLETYFALKDTEEILSQLVLDCEEVATLLRVPPSVVHQLERSGRLPGVRMVGHLRFKPQTVREFVEDLKEATERRRSDGASETHPTDN